MKIVLNPSPMNAKILSYPLEYVDYFLLNEVEASDICGIEATKDPQALMNGLVKQFPEAKIVLTLVRMKSRSIWTERVLDMVWRERKMT